MAKILKNVSPLDGVEVKKKKRNGGEGLEKENWTKTKQKQKQTIPDFRPAKR